MSYFSFYFDLVFYVTTDNPVAILGTVNFGGHVIDILNGEEHKETIPPSAITEELWELASPTPTIPNRRRNFLEHLQLRGRNEYLESFFDECEDGRVNNCPLENLVDENGEPLRGVIDVSRWFYPDGSMFILQYVKSCF